MRDGEMMVAYMSAVRLAGGRVVGCSWSLKRAATVEELEAHEATGQCVWGEIEAGRF